MHQTSAVYMQNFFGPVVYGFCELKVKLIDGEVVND